MGDRRNPPQWINGLDKALWWGVEGADIVTALRGLDRGIPYHLNLEAAADNATAYPA